MTITNNHFSYNAERLLNVCVRSILIIMCTQVSLRAERLRFLQVLHPARSFCRECWHLFYIYICSLGIHEEFLVYVCKSWAVLSYSLLSK